MHLQAVWETVWAFVKPADLDLHRFQNWIYLELSMINKDYTYDACYSIYFYLYLDMLFF